MKMYGSPLSVFAQRCMMVARAKGHELELVPPPGGIQSPEFRELSPTGRVPLLVLDDGSHLCESEAISYYLDEVLDGPSLLAGSALGRARTREIEAIVTCDIASGIKPIVIGRLFRMTDCEQAISDALVQMDKGLTALQSIMRPAPYAIGGTFGMADCLLIPILTLLELCAPITGTGAILENHPEALAYRDAAAAHPVVQQTLAEMREQFAQMTAKMAEGAQA